jgi:two-component system, chemotaxis family, protein-glutamate methylesterase/glutaminase
MEPAPRDLVVVGASAGGVEALTRFAAHLPAELPAAVVVVLHIPVGGASSMPEILSRSGPLPCVEAADATPLRRGHIHVAPPDRHVLVEEDVLRLSSAPAMHGHRPAVDALFRSAASPRTIGVVLSGALADGTAGMASIKERGGVAIVQDPADARCSGMPVSVLRHVPVDHVLPAGAIGWMLGRLVREHVEQPEDPQPDSEVRRAMWTALHTLDEKAALSERMRASKVAQSHEVIAERYSRARQESAEAAEVLRAYLIRGGLA